MTQATTYKRLRRSRTDRMIGGVCGGAAQYLGVDPVAVRVAYALITLITGGLALLAYPIMWILMPEDPAAQPWTVNPPAPGDYPSTATVPPPAA